MTPRDSTSSAMKKCLKGPLTDPLSQRAIGFVARECWYLGDRGAKGLRQRVGLAARRVTVTKRATGLRTVPRADACSSCGGLRRLPARHLSHIPLSTKWRQPGILMDVPPVLRGISDISQHQTPRSGPDGQPVEGSQLGKGPGTRLPHATYRGGQTWRVACPLDFAERRDGETAQYRS